MVCTRSSRHVLYVPLRSRFARLAGPGLAIVPFTAQQLQQRRPDLGETALLSLIADGISLWVDFIFIDQCARDIRRELDALPFLLENSKAHFVLGDRPIT